MSVLDGAPLCPDGIVRGWPIETAIGTLYCRHVGWGVLIDNSSNTIPTDVVGRPFVTVRGREYTATIGIYDESGEIERCYIHRPGEISDASSSVELKIIEAAKIAAEEYLMDYPEHRLQARYDQAVLAHTRARWVAEQAEEKFDDAVRELGRRSAAVEIARQELYTASQS